MSNEQVVKELQRKANQLRKNVLEMIGVGVAGHWGGSTIRRWAQRHIPMRDGVCTLSHARSVRSHRVTISGRCTSGRGVRTA